MSKTVDTIGTLPAATPLSPAEGPATYALPGAAALPGPAPSSHALFVSQRTDLEAIDGVDRPFFLWLLAGLIAATAACGLIAMSAVFALE